jgi:hypothetical protein
MDRMAWLACGDLIKRPLIILEDRPRKANVRPANARLGCGSSRHSLEPERGPNSTQGSETVIAAQRGVPPLLTTDLVRQSPGTPTKSQTNSASPVTWPLKQDRTEASACRTTTWSHGGQTPPEGGFSSTLKLL